jgi:glutamyl-tRNA synthetase
MILGKDKTKLSKRHGAESINSFKEKGYLPISIINYLARLGWAYGDQEIFTLNEMVSNFSLDNLSKSPAVFDPEKLSWVNNIQIKNYPNSELKERLKLEFIDGVDEELAINAVKEKNKDLNELQKSLNFCLSTNESYENELINELDNQAVAELKKFIIAWEAKKPKEIQEIKEVFTNYLNENEIKMKSLALPLRILLTGTKSSPGIFEILKILGHEIVIERIKKFIKNNEK